MKTIFVTVIGVAAFVAISIHLNGGTFGQKCAGFEEQEYQKCLQRLSRGEPKP